MQNIKSALDDSLFVNRHNLSSSKQIAAFWYGSICALAFSGQIEEAKALAIQLNVDINKIIQAVE